MVKSEKWNVWAFRHVSELIPTARIAATPGLVEDAAVDPGELLHQTFAMGGDTLTIADALRQTFTDALLVMKSGRVIADYHAPNFTLQSRHILFSSSKSVTAVVAGNCGSSALDVGESLATIKQTGVSVNYATLVGHNTVRQAVMGRAQRPPDAAELTKMRGLVWKAMADGAVGFSTGLQYIPGAYADIVEIITLARVAAEAGGLYASHMRNEGTEVEKAVDEAIRVGRSAGCPVQISHLKIDSPSRWGMSAKIIEMMNTLSIARVFSTR